MQKAAHTRRDMSPNEPFDFGVEKVRCRPKSGLERVDPLEVSDDERDVFRNLARDGLSGRDVNLAVQKDLYEVREELLRIRDTVVLHPAVLERNPLDVQLHRGEIHCGVCTIFLFVRRISKAEQIKKRHAPRI